LKDADTVLAVCQPNELYGIVRLTCVEGFATVTNNSCGPPCFAQRFSGIITRYEEVRLPDLSHLSKTWMPCPPSVSGMMLFSCFRGALTVVEGGCGERCEATSLLVYGASFVSPRMDHLAKYWQPCNPPFKGTVDLLCVYGKLNVTSNCRVGCYAGTAEVDGGSGYMAKIDYPQMEDSRLFPSRCPYGFEGDVVLQCWNGKPRVHSGACNAHCDSGQWVQPSDGAQIRHYNMDHNETTDLTCPATWSGFVELKCSRGGVSLYGGVCKKNCMAGSAFITLGVSIKYAMAADGWVYPLKLCPTLRYVGTVRLLCKDGKVTVMSGACYKHCTAGETAAGTKYMGLPHGKNSTVACAEQGSEVLSCWDGLVKVVSGGCISACVGGQIFDGNSTAIQHEAMGHHQNVSGTCTGFATGRVTVECDNGAVTVLPMPGQRCFRHCHEANVTIAGHIMPVPNMLHGQQAPSPCPDDESGDPVLGVLSFRCWDSQLLHVAGSCGPANCAAGAIESGGADLEHPQINDQMEAGPISCPLGWVGEGAFGCVNGTVGLKEVALFARVPVYEPNSTKTVAAQNASESELGVEPYSNRILLCECCLAPPRPKGPGSVPARDEWAILYWAALVGVTGFLGTIGGGYYAAKFVKSKGSRVHPDPNKDANAEAEALEDEEEEPQNQLAVQSPNQLRLGANAELAPKTKRIMLENKGANMAIEWREPVQGEWKQW
jgi:hypothetical protein